MSIRERTYVKNISETAISTNGLLFLPGQVKLLANELWLGKKIFSQYRGRLQGYSRDAIPTSDIETIGEYCIGILKDDTQTPTTVTVEGVDYDCIYTEIDGTPMLLASEVIITPTPVTGVSLNKETTSIDVDDTETLVATVAPAGATNKGVIWSSGNTAVATVDDDGVVTGVALGTAVITVTTADGEFTDTCTVTVPVHTVSVSLNKETTSIIVEGTETLVATVLPENATVKTVTWVSSDPTKAIVSNAGLVTALVAGETTITVTTTDGAFTDTCVVTVTTE